MSLNEEDNRPAEAQHVTRASRIAPILSIITSLVMIAVSIVALNIALDVKANVQATRDKIAAEDRPHGYVWDRINIDFKYSPYRSMTDQEAADAYMITLRDVKNLETLYLCAAELRAEAAVQKAVVAANKAFPQNKPYSHKPGQYDKFYGRFEAQATALEVAAKSAETGEIPCINPSDRTWPSVDVLITTTDGALRAALVTESDILFLTTSLEVAELNKNCVSKQRKLLEELKAKAVSSTRETYSVLSEQDKFIKIAHYDAVIELLQSNPKTNC